MSYTKYFYIILLLLNLQLFAQVAEISEEEYPAWQINHDIKTKKDTFINVANIKTVQDIINTVIKNKYKIMRPIAQPFRGKAMEYGNYSGMLGSGVVDNDSISKKANYVPYPLSNNYILIGLKTANIPKVKYYHLDLTDKFEDSIFIKLTDHEDPYVRAFAFYQLTINDWKLYEDSKLLDIVYKHLNDTASIYTEYIESDTNLRVEWFKRRSTKCPLPFYSVSYYDTVNLRLRTGKINRYKLWKINYRITDVRSYMIFYLLCATPVYGYAEDDYLNRGVVGFYRRIPHEDYLFLSKFYQCIPFVK